VIAAAGDDKHHGTVRLWDPTPPTTHSRPTPATQIRSTQYVRWSWTAGR
jgi:hypothetical protein